QITVDHEEWNIINIPAGIILNSDLTYYFTLGSPDVNSDQVSIGTSEGSSGGEHTGGSIFYFNSVSGEFEAEPIDDVDFKVVLRINSPGWKNLH
ncbi:MAG: hypothetical protein M3R25_14545, partial [Bacteroidota bacterium]|nr:hypothetical protein [Bacteroidota bacterium]